MDALAILILANALALIVTTIAFSRSLHRLLRTRNPKLAFSFKRRYAVAIVLGGVMVTGVYGATLLQHTFPATPGGSSQVITTICTTLTLETVGMVTSFSESMLFNCGLSAAAITGNRDGTSTPTFTLPAGANSLSLVNHMDNAIICGGGSNIASGSPHAFSATDSLDYCLTSNSYPSGGIASFKVTWSQ
ncbi:hypothetical protein E6H31_07340 [Candidatus Bathyarchaeota archaeon]|nr:MAG: hypothetical protein E6H31_07340 [Candidatus Bathyarchaeota archaeon]